MHGGVAGEGDRSRHEDGFTLLEVLIAFAVLAVLLVPILQVFGGGLGNAETARAYATATLLARSKLDEIASETELTDGESDGRFDDVPYRWRSTISRDETEVIEPDSAVAERKSERKRRSGLASDSGFGSNGGTTSAGRSSFGSASGNSSRQSSFGSSSSRQSGFGSSSSRQSGFGSSSSRQSSFGSSSARQSGLGTKATTPSGAKSGSGAASGTGDSSGLPGGPTSLEDAAELAPYRITVTVAWGEGRSGGEVTLTSMRSGRAPTKGQ